MKVCSKCGLQYTDDVIFCTECGNRLSAMAPPPPSQPQPQQGGPVYQPNGMPQQNVPNTGKKSNGIMIAIILVLTLVIIASAVIIILVMNKDDKSGGDNTTAQVQQTEAPAPAQPENAENTGEQSQADGDGDAGEETDGGNTDGAADGETQDLSEYQTYFDEADETFNGYIMSGVESGQFSNYLGSLGKALGEQDATACEESYEKLKNLEEKLEKNSDKKISRLENKLSSLKGSSYTASAKKSASFVRTETAARIAARNGKYNLARKKYEKCIRILKKAKAKGKANKKRNQTSGNDDFYRPPFSDDSTYITVTTEWLTRRDVRALSGEMRRYYMNTLHAAYGYRFQNSTIQAFFDYQYWYSADYTIDVGAQGEIRELFSDTARHNYKVLQNQ